MAAACARVHALLMPVGTGRGVPILPELVYALGSSAIAARLGFNRSKSRGLRAPVTVPSLSSPPLSCLSRRLLLVHVMSRRRRCAEQFSALRAAGVSHPALRTCPSLHPFTASGYCCCYWDACLCKPSAGLFNLLMHKAAIMVM